MTVTSVVRAATATDVEPVALLLAAAFRDDPVMDRLQPDPTRRAQMLPRYFAHVLIHRHPSCGGIDVAAGDDGRIDGAAVWDPPGHWRQTMRHTIRAAPTMLQVLRSRVMVGVRMQSAFDRHHYPHPHWYLARIGVRTDSRGQGVASALIRSRLDRLDASADAAYLVCTRAENIAVYQRFGFAVTEEFRATAEGPSVWGMLRPPRPDHGVTASK